MNQYYRGNTSRKLFCISILLTMFLCAKAFAKSKDLEEAGDILQWGIPVTAGIISSVKLDGEGLVQLGEGAMWTAISTHFLKVSLNAQRPNGQDFSMPSSHTSAAAQGAAYLQFRYGWKYGVPAYLLTGLVAYSRVDNDYHYWRDVIIGAALGTAIQYSVTLGGFSVTNLAIAPYFDGDSVGLYASMNF
ncbi:phosphatase PAP2 family protein [Vibrio salinus]|uniref:phosphatase PAP2 family protein n=1 Tax=Vibrio salinus TaxID=2899784 RepID=UPI001E388548|nr:phosphatase PAP2 family protein [Vibrio salinus]MCE0494792.1 phosphatase PAP2 family protein [Vibrio salinus]